MRSAALALAVVSAVVWVLHGSSAQHHIVFGRIGPAQSQLFVANGDGTNERPLLPLTGLDYSPSLSYDRQWVVFTSERDGSADIYRVRPDGSDLQRLTDDPAYDDQAVLSPDGKTVAFVSSRADGRAHLFLLDVESRRATQLTSGEAGDFRPAWSPDGTMIAFTSDRNTHSPNLPGRWERLQSTVLFVIQRDGKGLRALTRGRGVAGAPRWASDSKRIYYYETTELGGWYAQRGDLPRGTTQIVSIDMTSGTRKELTQGDMARLWPQPFSTGGFGFLEKKTNGNAHIHTVSATGAVSDGPQGQVRGPSWSTDGTQLVFYRVVPPSGNGAFSPQFSKSSDFKFTRIHNGNFPAFSSDGSKFVVGIERNGPNDEALEIAQPDGTGRKTLFYKEGFSAFTPAWSPDGNQIAFSVGHYFRPAGHPKSDVGLINADGSGFRVLTNDESNNGFPTWSPDGKRIAYKKDEHLVILTLADGQVRNLTEPGPQHDNFPQWSPKGDWIAFTSDRASDEDFRIYLVRPDGRELHELTHSPGDGHSAWSPDGEWIIYSSAQKGFKDERALLEAIPQPYGELFIIRPDGTGLRQLTDNQWEDATPAWMPERQ